MRNNITCIATSFEGKYKVEVWDTQVNRKIETITCKTIMEVLNVIEEKTFNQHKRK